MKQVQYGHTNLCKGIRVKAGAGEQVEKERKHGSKKKKITRGNPEQMLALALSR